MRWRDIGRKRENTEKKPQWGERAGGEQSNTHSWSWPETFDHYRPSGSERMSALKLGKWKGGKGGESTFLEIETYLGSKPDLLFATRETWDRLIFLSTSFLFCKMEVTVSNSQEELTGCSHLTTSSQDAFSSLAHMHFGLCCAWSLRRVQLFATPWTVARQAPLSMGILQTRILEWVAMSASRGSFQPRDRTRVSCITGRFFTSWATREAPYAWYTHCVCVCVCVVQDIGSYP